MSFSLPAWLDGCRAALDAFLVNEFEDAWPAAFAEPLRYPVFGGGKRVRPALAVAAYEALARDPHDLSPVLPPAAAVELVHTYSLVHDDLPCMDDDDERRGRPTVHVAFDEATAVLSGDALLTHAFTILADGPTPAEVRVQMVRTLSQAAGYRGMVGGQVADIAGAHADLETVLRLHRLKTGALITAATVLGGLAAEAGPDVIAALERYGNAVGLAFQLADDVLDEGEDDTNPSVVRLLGREETRRRARALSEEAIEAVAGLPRPAALQALAAFTVERTV